MSQCFNTTFPAPATSLSIFTFYPDQDDLET